MRPKALFDVDNSKAAPAAPPSTDNTPMRSSEGDIGGQFLAQGPGTRHVAGQERGSPRGIGRYQRHADHRQGRQRQEAAAACHGIQRAGQGRGASEQYPIRRRHGWRTRRDMRSVRRDMARAIPTADSKVICSKPAVLQPKRAAMPPMM